MELNYNNFEDEILNADSPVLVEFFAKWCNTCNKMQPTIKEIKNSKSFKVCKVNIDEQKELATRYGIMSVPTLVIFKDGEILQKTTGIRSKKEILAMLR